MQSIGTRLYSWRHTYRLSQQKLADELAVSVRTVGRWERGEDYPAGWRLTAILELLSAPPAGWQRDA
jgi:DNA-binding transcriptional regulator YiaG